MTPEDLLRRTRRTDSGCLEWTGPRDSQGYGKIGQHLAHRLAWALTCGPIPDRLCVLHHCDNPPCIEIADLWLGTRADNNADRDAKGRSFGGSQPGDLCPHARLTSAEVLQIRALYARGGTSYRRVGEAFGVSIATIADIINGRTWRILGSEAML